MKKILSLFALVLMSCMGAWAQGLLPKVSTKEAPVYYRIINLRCGKYAAYAGDDARMSLTTTADDNSKFYFVDANVSGLPEGVKAVKIVCAAAPDKFCANTNSFTDAGIVWYLKSNVYTEANNYKATVAINKDANNWTNDGYGWNNFQGKGNEVDTYRCTDIGSAWSIEPCDWNNIEVSIKNWQHDFYIGYRDSDKKVEGSTTKVTNWTFVSAGEGKYYLKTGDYYMGAMPGAHDNPPTVTTNQAQAEKFTVGKYNGSSMYYTLGLTSADSENDGHMNLHGVHWTGANYTARGVEYSAVRWAAAADASHWLIENPFTGYTQEAIDALQANIDDAMSAIYADKIGYPDRHNATNTTVITEMSQYQTTRLGSPVNAENYAEALAALNAIYTINDVNLPVSGKAYRMAFVGNNGTKKYIQTSGNAGDEASAAEFVCGKDGEKFIFVLKDGSKFMNYQGANTALASYNAEYNSFTIQPLATSTSAHLGSSTAVDRFGYVYMTSAKRASGNNSEGCMLVNQSTGAYDNSSAPYFNGTLTSAITFEEVANDVYVKLTNPNVGGTSGLDGKYVGTFSAPYHVTLPAGVKAYTAAISGSTVNFTELGTAVPANTGVLLYAESADADINENAVPVGTAAAAGANAFAAMIDGTINAGDYVLGNGTNGVGFYARVSATTAKNKAYIPGSAGSNLNAFRFDFEDTVTGIEAVESNVATTIFDLQGRRVQSAKNGIYIVNGKKVIR